MKDLFDRHKGIANQVLSEQMSDGVSCLLYILQTASLEGTGVSLAESILINSTCRGLPFSCDPVILAKRIPVVWDIYMGCVRKLR